MAGVDDGVAGKGEQPLADGNDDLVEVRVLPAGGSRAALEQGVACEDHAVGDKARRARGVSWRRDCP